VDPRPGRRRASPAHRPLRLAAVPPIWAEAAAPLAGRWVVKAGMSSSGKGQSVVEGPVGNHSRLEAALAVARGAGARVIVEEFLRFEADLSPCVREAVGWAHPVSARRSATSSSGRLPVQLAGRAGTPGCQRPATCRSDGPPRTDHLGGAGTVWR